ncbi:PREDICTED: uncharacterized protein LOC106817631 [Priapulus caudatus]|uniref:Uncharacterized protein LOC106817631 n=1 Tax=Priapulus caudatus TaxID=37621 RepID=A0ABM1F028_PRICU|nr:PREDICTED: uncharacterized protein LOC106817631 [Priapulus caudatus]
MGKVCVAEGCHKREDFSPELHFYRIPKDKERRAKWLAVINRKNWTPTEHDRLCSSHFISGEKSDHALSPDFVPSIFAYVKSPAKRRKVKALDDFNRRQAMKKRKIDSANQSTAAAALLELSDITPTPQQFESATDYEDLQNDDGVLHISTQTEISGSFLYSVGSDNEKLREENLALKTKLKFCSFDAKTLEGNDSKVKDLTGLPKFSVFMAVFSLIDDHLSDKCKISKVQQFLLVLMRMRHGLSNQFLAYLFNMHESSVSRIFLDGLDKMYAYVVPALIYWPDKDIIRHTLPVCFRTKYKNCVSIIDCFEIFCERPADLRARAQTYSQYKSHNTVKFLISITPQGHISFISKGWGGRTSDKFLTEQSAYLDYLLPGDTVLADRGFDIEDSVAVKGACLEIPAFTRGKSQLDAVEVENTRAIASVRIHVERVIGNLRKKYTLLKSIIPIRMLQCQGNTNVTTLDKVVFVACALCNAMPSVVSSD